MSRGLVLSGGGSVGIAWQTGLVVGLAEGGVDVSRADMIIGTSAGSAVGARLALGHDLRAEMNAPAVPPVEPQESPRSSEPAATSPTGGMQGLFAIIAEVVSKGGGAREVRKAIGRHALAADTISEARFVERFADLATDAWPARFSCTAVDVETGEFTVWNSESGADVPSAVASSCAVPGLFPPITVRGRRYMDGGMRSAANADLAKGCARVLVVSVIGGAGRAPVGDARRSDQMQRRAEHERRILTEAGATVEAIEPDAESAAVMGVDLMNFAIMRDVAQAGRRQGRAEAERLRPFWA